MHEARGVNIGRRAYLRNRNTRSEPILRRLLRLLPRRGDLSEIKRQKNQCTSSSRFTGQEAEAALMSRASWLNPAHRFWCLKMSSHTAAPAQATVRVAKYIGNRVNSMLILPRYSTKVMGGRKETCGQNASGSAVDQLT